MSSTPIVCRSAFLYCGKFFTSIALFTRLMIQSNNLEYIVYIYKLKHNIYVLRESKCELQRYGRGNSEITPLLMHPSYNKPDKTNQIAKWMLIIICVCIVQIQLQIRGCYLLNGEIGLNSFSTTSLHMPVGEPCLYLFVRNLKQV